MNKIYKVMYSKVKQCAVVVSEIAKSHGHNGESSGVRKHAALTAAVLIALGSFSFAGMPSVQAESLYSNDYVGTNYKDDNGKSYSSGETKNYHGGGARGVGSNTLGMNAIAGKNTITIGDRDASPATESVYIGTKYDAENQVHPSSGHNVVSVGYGSDATGTGSIAIGSGASADPWKDVSDTDKKNANKNNNSIAVGYEAQAQNNNIAIGANSVATAAASTDTARFRKASDGDYNAPSSYISVGSDTVKRRITNVAAGSDDNDVATVGQLSYVEQEAKAKGSWKLTAGGTNESTVEAGSTVDFSAGTDGNLSVTKTADSNNVTIGLNKDVTLGKAAQGKGGSLSVYQDPSSAGQENGNDQLGSHVRIDGSTVSIRYQNGTKDSDARGVVLGVAKDSSNPLGYMYLADGNNSYYVHGTMTSDPQALQGRLVYNSSKTGYNYIANLEDGISFSGDAVKAGSTTTNTTADTRLDPTAANHTLSIKGGVTDTTKLTSNNIGVVTTPTEYDGTLNNGVTKAGGLTIQLAKDLTDITSITSQTTGSTTGAKVTLDTKDNNIDVNQGKVTNLSDGTVDATSTDAVTGKQLYNLDNSSVKYDTTGTKVDKTKITLAGGATGTTITNVKAGTISANSTDAVNGAQLYAEQQARAQDKTKYYSVHEGPQIAGFSTNENNDGASAWAGLAAGYETGTAGIGSTVVGSYSGVMNTGTTSSVDLRGAASISLGTLNLNQNTDTSKTFSGVANSIIGQGNVTTNSNAAIILGAGNTITDSYKDVNIDTSTMKGSTPEALEEALQKAVPESGGQVMAIGGGNKISEAYKTQVVGLGNTVSGTELNYVEGFNNTVTGGTSNYIIGAKNTLDSGNNNVIFGDNHKLSSKSNNVIIGSADDENKELTASNAVVIGHNADVSVDGGVAIGSGSVSAATDEEDAEGYDPVSTATNKASTNTSATWKATTGAVSIGGVNGNTTTTRRITNLAAGFNDTDAVNVAQIKKLANIDASNIGTNLKGSDSKTAATTDEQNTNENAWGAAIGTGNVEDKNGQLVTGGTVYSALENQKKDLSVYAGWGIDIRKNNKNGNLISLQRNLGHIVNVNGESIPKPEVEGYSLILGGEFSNYRSYLDRPFLRNKKWGASGHNSVVVGGFDNLSSGRDSVELGGFLNEATGTYSSVLGGEQNITKGSYSTVIGGWDNYAYGKNSTVVGGEGNVAYGASAVIGGGGNRAGSCFDDGTSIRGAIAIGGSGNQAAGSHSVALGGFGANVYASGSTGIAGGSTGFDAYEALAAGYNSTVTVAKGTAIGYTATTNEQGTIAFGHDKGDTYYDGDARYFVGSGSFARWPQKAYRVSQNFYDANGKQITEKEYMALMNPDYTWNDYDKRPYFEETYTTAYYNRLVKVADGQKAHDTVVMEQLTPYTRSDASNIGANLKTYTVGEDGETITEANATADQKKANENAWGEAIGTGKIADPDASDKETNGSQQLVTGGTVYKALNGGLTKIIVGTPGKDGKDGTPGTPGTIGLVGPAGADGKNAEVDITIQQGKDEESKGVKGANGVDGQDGITRIVYKDAAGDHQVATMEDGLKFAGDDGQKDANKVIAKKLNNIVDIIGGAKGDLTEGNIGVNNDSGKLKVQLVKDLTGITSISGSTDDKGAKITLDTTDKNISVNGGSIKDVATNLDQDGEIISGNENNAANMSDVSKLINNAADSNGKKLADKANVDASNIGTNLNATTDEQNTNENAWGKAIGTGKIADSDASDKETNGSQQLVTGGTVYKALNGGMTKIVIGTPGENGKDGAPGTIGLVGPAGADGKNAEVDITIQQGKDEESKGVKGANGVDGQDGITRIVYKDAAGDHQVATMEDGLKFAGDDGQKDANKVIAKKLNNIVDIIGGAKGDLTEGNIGVNNDSGKLKIQLAQELTGITSISGSTGSNGAKITLDTNDQNISVNGGKITDVASGLSTNDGSYNAKDANNAANISDVNSMISKAVTDAKGETQQNLDKKANVDASNIGTKLKGADGKTAATEDEQKANLDKWGEAIGTGEVKDGSNQLVTGNTVYNAVKDKADKSYVDTQLSTKANTDGSNIDADKFSKKVAIGNINDSDERAVSGKTVNEAIQTINGNIDGKANKNLDNIDNAGKNVIKDQARAAVTIDNKGLNTNVVATQDDKNHTTTYTINVEGNGKVAAKDTGLISGDTIYNELRPATDGTYIKTTNTTAQNLTSLDTQVRATHDLINSDGKTIKIGGSDAATKIDVNGKDGKGRVITGVVSDANDPTSAANVGYVNGVTSANTQQIYRDMNNAYGRLNNNINKAAAGSNALAALHPLDYDPDDKADFAVGYGHYRNANAAAVGAFYHPNENTMVNVGVSLGNGDPGFNAGVSFKVGRGGAGREAMSKTEMAKVINSQSKEIDALKKDNADKDKRIDALEQKMAEILAKLDKNGK